MDNLAHTLVGATLAETGLKRWTPLAVPTLLIGANLPDIDGLATLGGGDFSLFFRRGWTHGVLALAIQPALLAGAMLLWDRYVRRRKSPDLPPARPGPLLALAYLSVLTHPAFDWLNTYGVRLLMPFDGTWFYGDTLFIIDPWLWLLTATAAVLASSGARRGAVGWSVLGLATSALVLGTGLVPLAAKAVWGVGIAAILAVRLFKKAPAPFVERVALGCGGVLLLYIGAMYAGSGVATRQASEWVRAQGVSVEGTSAGPIAANPFVRDVIVLTPGRYLFVEVDWLGSERVRFSDAPLPREQPGPVVQAALAAPEVRGFRNWLRYPTWKVEEREAGWRVWLYDVRYSRSRPGGIGTAVVNLDRELRPVASEP
jgi:inner membrane protein